LCVNIKSVARYGQGFKTMWGLLLNHGDPADRIIIASARLLNATLVTSDREILRYAAGEYVKVVLPK
jgi:PIN domain nuclease of toxin-antitoxin system